MSAVCPIDLGRRAEIDADVVKLAGRILSELGATAVYRFGSYAREQLHEASDIDLLVVANLPGRRHERSGPVLALAPDWLPIEPLVYTPDEIERMDRVNHPLLATIRPDLQRFDGRGWQPVPAEQALAEGS